MTVSTDGSVLWWDIRRLSEPVESMPLREKGSETSLGGVVLEYDPAAGPTNFMVGTEQVRGVKQNFFDLDHWKDWVNPGGHVIQLVHCRGRSRLALSRA